MKKHIIMFSGGKDSTCILLKMLENNMQVDEIIYANTGVEFPEMGRHILQVEKHINRPIKKFIPEHGNDFEYFASKHVVNKGKDIERFGMGWPTIRNRWCTYNLKVKKINDYLKNYDCYKYIGIAYDEMNRIEKSHNDTKKSVSVYPLVEWKITEKEALKYCYSKGFNWSGLYEKFNRVSCYLCPLQRLGELECIFKYYKPLWNEMLRLDDLMHNKFRNDYSLNELDRRFNDGLAQLNIFAEAQQDVAPKV